MHQVFIDGIQATCLHQLLPKLGLWKDPYDKIFIYIIQMLLYIVKGDEHCLSNILVSRGLNKTPDDSQLFNATSTKKIAIHFGSF